MAATSRAIKRMRRLVSGLAVAPPELAERIEALLVAPPRETFATLHVLEAAVLELAAEHLADVDLTAARQRWAAYAPD